jgi:hypothetical protein
VSLDPDLARALEVLEHGLGPLQVLDVRPTPPERRPAPAPAPAAAGPGQPTLRPHPRAGPDVDVHHRPVHPHRTEPVLA